MKIEIEDFQLTIVCLLTFLIVALLTLKGCDADSVQMKEQLWKLTNSPPKKE